MGDVGFVDDDDGDADEDGKCRTVVAML